MASNRDRRVSNLENVTGDGRDEIRVSVNWRDDGLVLDHDTGDYITADLWRKRHPKDRLILVGLDDDYD